MKTKLSKQLIKEIDKFLKILNKQSTEIGDLFSYENAGKVLKKYTVVAGSNENQYIPEWGGWIFVAWSGNDTPARFFNEMRCRLEKLRSNAELYGDAFVTKKRILYFRQKCKVWKENLIEFRLQAYERYYPSRGFHLKAVHDNLAADRDKWNGVKGWESKAKKAEHERDRQEKIYQDAWNKMIAIANTIDLEYEDPNPKSTLKLKITKVSECFASSIENLEVRYSLFPLNWNFYFVKAEVTDCTGITRFKTDELGTCGNNVFKWNGQDNEGNLIALPHLSPFKIKIIAQYKNVVLEDTRVSEVKISEIKISLPEIAEPENEIQYEPYDLPADFGLKKGENFAPKTLVEIDVKIKTTNGAQVPAPIGTRITLDVVRPSHNKECDISYSGTFLGLDKHGNQNFTTTDEKGSVKVVFLGSVCAERWFVSMAQENIGQMETLNADTFIIVGSEFKFENIEKKIISVKSPKIRIVAGTPLNISFINKNRWELWHRSFAKNKKDFLFNVTGLKRKDLFGNWVSVDGKFPIHIGAIGLSESAPQGTASYIVAYITDRFGNPTEMNKGVATVNGYWLSCKVEGSFVGIPGFFPTNGFRWSDPSTRYLFTTEKMLGTSVYPKGIVVGAYIHSYALATKEKLSFELVQYINGSRKKLDTFPPEISTETSPHPILATLQELLVNEETKKERGLLFEIGLDMIPILGDAKSLLEYGVKVAVGKKLSVFDHLLALISAVGLAVDSVTVATVGITGALSLFIKAIKSLVLLFVKIVAKSVKRVAKLFIKFFSMLTDLIKYLVDPLLKKKGTLIEADFKKIVQFADDMMPFINSIRNRLPSLPEVSVPAKLKKFNDWFSIIALVVTTPQILINVLPLLKKYTVEKLVDILYFIAYYEGDVQSYDL